MSSGLWTLLDLLFSIGRIALGPGSVVRFCIIATDTRVQHSLGRFCLIGWAFQARVESQCIFFGTDRVQDGHGGVSEAALRGG